MRPDHVTTSELSTLRSLRSLPDYLNGGVIEHFLPGIVELPLVRISDKLMLGQGDRLLGGRVDF